jgi:hypothetical protein
VDSAASYDENDKTGIENDITKTEYVMTEDRSEGKENQRRTRKKRMSFLPAMLKLK